VTKPHKFLDSALKGHGVGYNAESLSCVNGILGLRPTQKLTHHRFAHCHSRREAGGNPESRNWMPAFAGMTAIAAARVSDLGPIAIGGMPQAI